MTHISRRSAVEPFHAMDVLAAANRMRAEGHRIISMAVGQPADPAPALVLETARNAIAYGRIGYTDALGLSSLREAVAGYYRDHHALDIDPARIAITTGSSAAFNLAFLAMFDPGDHVAITRPGYPAYRNIMKALGLNVVEIDVDEQSGPLSAARLKALHNSLPLKGLLFASPANPTGAALSNADMDELIDMADELGISVISDEIYHRLNYSGPDHTALARSRKVTVINSFSKYYCMTGWRVGWMVMPEPLVRPVERIAQSLYISPPEISQLAAVAAFRCSDELDGVRARYLENRAILQDRLPKLGFDLAAPMDGAFYAWCHCHAHGNHSMDLARRILVEAGVAATPGLDFDPVEGHRYMRFSYAGSNADMMEAMERLHNLLG